MSMDEQVQHKLNKKIACPYCKNKLKLEGIYYLLSSWFSCSCSQWRYSVKNDTWIRFPIPQNNAIMDKPIITEPFIFR